MTTVKPDPKEIAQAIRKECDIKENRHQKLIPFVDAGWQLNDQFAHKPIACGTVVARYTNGQYEVSFPGWPNAEFCDSAEEAIKLVAEVGEQFKQH